MRFLSIVNYAASYAIIAVAVSATTTIEYSVVKKIDLAGDSGQRACLRMPLLFR